MYSNNSTEHKRGPDSGCQHDRHQEQLEVEVTPKRITCKGSARFVLALTVLITATYLVVHFLG